VRMPLPSPFARAFSSSRSLPVVAKRDGLFPAKQPESLTLFLRRSPVVDRVWHPLDGLLYNLMTMNVVVMFSIPLLTAVAFYPTGSLPKAILIAAPFCLAQGLVYAFLASSMPRSGGDYHFQSRLISGSAATVFAFTGVVLSGAMWMAIGGWFASKVAVTPFLVLFGFMTDQAGLVSLGRWFLAPHGLFVLSLLVILWCALLNVWGMRAYAWFQRVFWLLGLAALAVVLVLLYRSTHAEFVLSFDSLARDAFGIEAAYHTTLQRARELGFDPARDPGVLGGTLSLLPVAAFVLIYPAWSVQQSGEIKRAGELRMQLLMIVVAEIVTVLLSAGVLALAISRFGAEFLGASAFLFFGHPEQLPMPVAPFFGLFMGSLWTNGLVMVVVAILFNAWFWMWAPDITLAASRVLLAMSSDRLLPHQIGAIEPRSKAPVNAILLFSLLCVGAAALYAYSDFWLLTLDAALLNILAFGVTCGAAVVFPFTKRELYRESTAARYEVLGVPVISIAGGIFLLFTGFVIARFLMDDALGINVPVSLAFVGGLYLGSLVLHYGYLWYRRHREGIDVEVVYREVPAPGREAAPVGSVSVPDDKSAGAA
jgi:basic amino acid/polyamine antiporter, APA family